MDLLSKDWLEADPDLAGALYVDGHVRLYHGHQTELPRRYVSRQRLLEQLFQILVQRVGKWWQRSVPDQWPFHGRRVKSVDGSTVSMPDTPKNQKEYPQPKSQKAGIGFPIARLVVIFCVISGAALEMAISPHKGKKTGENTLFRSMWDSLEADDIVLAG